MNDSIDLPELLTPHVKAARRRGVFALLGLGMVESLSSGAISTSEAVRLFFHAENCHYVHKRMRDNVADEFMSRGVQLPDLFDALSEREAQQEFQRELSNMRSLCLRLLAQPRAVA